MKKNLYRTKEIQARKIYFFSNPVFEKSYNLDPVPNLQKKMVGSVLKIKVSFDLIYQLYDDFYIERKKLRVNFIRSDPDPGLFRVRSGSCFFS